MDIATLIKEYRTKTGMTQQELADKVLYEAQVFITPGIVFGSLGDRYIRLSLCANEAALLEALDRIKNRLNK
mgnify:CR=1 FL=1